MSPGSREPPRWSCRSRRRTRGTSGWPSRQSARLVSARSPCQSPALPGSVSQDQNSRIFRRSLVTGSPRCVRRRGESGPLLESTAASSSRCTASNCDLSSRTISGDGRRSLRPQAFCSSFKRPCPCSSGAGAAQGGVPEPSPSQRSQALLGQFSNFLGDASVARQNTGC